MIKKNWTLKLNALALALGLALPNTAKSEENTIYDVINREDIEAFSDMVVLGYNIDDVDRDGYTPLMIASAAGKVDFVRFLIKNDANVDKRSFSGATAMHRAALGGHINIINILFNAGAKLDIPDFNGDTPLMQAVRGNRRFAVERLIRLGADINFKNAKNETALTIAQKKHFNEITELLRSKGAK